MKMTEVVGAEGYDSSIPTRVKDVDNSVVLDNSYRLGAAGRSLVASFSQ